MSLEVAIAENTVALKEVAELLRQSNAGRDAAVQKIVETSGDAGATRPAGRPRVSAADKKAAEEAAAKAAAEQAEAAAKGDEPNAAPPSIDDIRASCATYMSASEDPKLAPARKTFVRSVLDHLGVEKIVQVPEDDRAKVIAWFEASARGETVNFDEGQDDPVVVEDDDLMG